MSRVLWIGLESFGFAVVLTPIFRDIFRSYNVVDRPDQDRKVHVHPIPRVGGIAIAISYMLAFYLARPGEGIAPELSLVAKLMPAAIVVFATGLIDDFFGLKPWQKIIGQLIAAGLAWWAGARIETLGSSYTLPLFWSAVITVGWLLVCTNAFNLVDGLDGLAAGVGLFATLTMFAAALLQGNDPLAFATLPLAGCLLGFLCFNFNPATVFLGDCGSLLIGFLLGCFGVIWAQKSVTLLGITAPLMAMSLPLIDVLLCIIRRWLRNQPVFSADRGHIHHRLLDRGLSPRQAVFVLYGLCALAASFSLLQGFVNNFYIAAFVTLLFGAVSWIGVHYLGYTEFMLAGKLLRTSMFQRNINAQLNLTAFEKAFSEAETLEDCWRVLVGVRDIFGFAGVRMYVNGRLYESWPEEVQSPRYWSMQIPLTQMDFIELTREIGSSVLPTTVVPFVELLAASFSARLNERPLPVEAPADSVALQTGN